MNVFNLIQQALRGYLKTIAKVNVHGSLWVLYGLCGSGEVNIRDDSASGSFQGGGADRASV
jgi:hypothetical protein